MSHLPKFYSAGVLAGAYRGKDVGERALLNHGVTENAINIGRLKRAGGEALCNKKLDLVDFYGWESVQNVNCPKCLDILYRIGALHA